MLKRPETIVVWRHWFGRSLRPGKPSNSPRGAEGATMARRVPFPPSSIPAYIEQSMKLFVCLSMQHHNIHMSCTSDIGAFFPISGSIFYSDLLRLRPPGASPPAAQATVQAL